MRKQFSFTDHLGIPLIQIRRKPLWHLLFVTFLQPDTGGELPREVAARPGRDRGMHSKAAGWDPYVSPSAFDTAGMSMQLGKASIEFWFHQEVPP
jgi:hypothetical protein